jgi:hypothetical protein
VGYSFGPALSRGNIALSPRHASGVSWSAQADLPRGVLIRPGHADQFGGGMGGGGGQGLGAGTLPRWSISRLT